MKKILTLTRLPGLKQDPREAYAHRLKWNKAFISWANQCETLDQIKRKFTDLKTPPLLFDFIRTLKANGAPIPEKLLSSQPVLYEFLHQCIDILGDKCCHDVGLPESISIPREGNISHMSKIYFHGFVHGEKRVRSAYAGVYKERMRTYLNKPKTRVLIEPEFNKRKDYKMPEHDRVHKVDWKWIEKKAEGYETKRKAKGTYNCSPFPLEGLEFSAKEDFDNNTRLMRKYSLTSLLLIDAMNFIQSGMHFEGFGYTLYSAQIARDIRELAARFPDDEIHVVMGELHTAQVIAMLLDYEKGEQVLKKGTALLGE